MKPNGVPLDSKMQQALASLEMRRRVQREQRMHISRVATSYMVSAQILLPEPFQRATCFHDLAALIAVRAGASMDEYHRWCDAAYDQQKTDFRNSDPQKFREVFAQAEEVRAAAGAAELLGADGAPLKAVEEPRAAEPTEGEPAK